MAIKDIKGCSLADGEYLGCAHCGGGHVRQTTEHLQTKAQNGELRIPDLPCGGLQTAVEAALRLPSRDSQPIGG